MVYTILNGCNGLYYFLNRHLIIRHLTFLTVVFPQIHFINLLWKKITANWILHMRSTDFQRQKSAKKLQVSLEYKYKFSRFPYDATEINNVLNLTNKQFKICNEIIFIEVTMLTFIAIIMFAIVFRWRNVFLRVCLIPSVFVVVNKGGWRSKKTKMPLAFTWRFLMAAWNKVFTFMLQVL